MGIIVTEAANNKMIDKFHKDFLRLSLSDGGCNGYQYYWDIAETPSDNDYIIGKLVVDVNSMTYLKGSTIGLDASYDEIYQRLVKQRSAMLSLQLLDSLKKDVNIFVNSNYH